MVWAVCAVVLSLWAGGARAQKINLPPVTRTTLPNGARIVLMEYHRAPTLVLTAQFRGGSVYDPADKTGVADLTATLLRKGTDTRTAQQIAEQIDTLGGSLSAGAGDDRISVTLDVLSKDTDTGMDLFADIIRHPTLPGRGTDAGAATGDFRLAGAWRRTRRNRFPRRFRSRLCRTPLRTRNHYYLAEKHYTGTICALFTRRFSALIA